MVRAAAIDLEKSYASKIAEFRCCVDRARTSATRDNLPARGGADMLEANPLHSRRVKNPLDNIVAQGEFAFIPANSWVTLNLKRNGVSFETDEFAAVRDLGIVRDQSDQKTA